MNNVKTPTMLWQDFDASQLPLEIFEIKTQEKNGLVFKHFYFTGRQFENSAKSRVYAVVCYKNSNSKKPAVLYIGKPQQAIDTCELAFWASNGFVAMSIDMKGETGKKGHHTVYPLEASYANFDEKNQFAISDDAKHTMWFEYTANAMRAVTYLKQLSFVKTVSVLTHGNGSYVGLAVMAIDKRVEDGGVVFGSLHVNVEGYTEIKETADKNEIAQALANNELLDIWMMGIAPQSYLPLIECPVYFILGGNSIESPVLLQSETFSRANEKSRLLVLPNSFDYLPNDIATGLAKWFKGTTVQNDMKLSVVEDSNAVKVQLCTSSKLEELELWYCRDNTQPCKNWLPATLTPVEEGKYISQLDMYEQNANVSVVAVKLDTICVSTPILSFVPKQLNQLKQPTSVVYSGETRCFVPLNDDDKWHGAELSADICKGHLNIKGTKGKNLCTFAVSDKSNTFQNSDTLSFDICCETKQTLTVKYFCNFGSNMETYVVSTELFGDGKWQRIILSNSDFKRDTDGHSMSKDISKNALIFTAKEKFIVNNIYAV